MSFERTDNFVYKSSNKVSLLLMRGKKNTIIGSEHDIDRVRMHQTDENDVYSCLSQDRTQCFSLDLNR